jgi:hypothetical protein
VYVFFYNQHALFIRDNGAIDIRSVEEGMNAITAPWYRDEQQLLSGLKTAFFEKEGVVGGRVWDR